MKTHLLLCLIITPALRADTTIDPAAAHAYGANTGWIDTRGDVANGAVVGEFICSGYIYGANCGCISLGSGAPTNGVRYQNSAPRDYGVNTQDYTSPPASSRATPTAPTPAGSPSADGISDAWEYEHALSTRPCIT